MLVGTLNELNGEQASILISLLLNHLSDGSKLPKEILDEVHPLVARFVTTTIIVFIIIILQILGSIRYNQRRVEGEGCQGTLTLS